MKTVWICLGLILVAFVIDAYVENPVGSLKVVHDLEALAVSLLPGGTPTQPVADASSAAPSPQETVVTPPHVTPVAQPPQPTSPPSAATNAPPVPSGN
jgi:hypothetical protein